MSRGPCRLSAVSDTCATAQKRSKDWVLDKAIITRHGAADKESLRVCLFEGDKVEVSYKLCATRKKGEVIVFWAVKVTNHSREDTHGLRIGFTILVDEKSSGKTFDGFEAQHPVIHAGCAHTYYLSGKVSANGCKKLRVATHDVIYDDSYIAPALKEIVSISDDICEDEFVLRDEILEFEKPITTDATFTCGAEYEMDDNVRDDTCVINNAEIIGKSSGIVAKDCAKICFNKANVELACVHAVINEIPQWCLCQGSERVAARGRCDTIIKYTVEANRTKTQKCAMMKLYAKLKIDGCVPRYAKPFIVSVWAIDDGANRQLLKKENVTLGGDCEHWESLKIDFDVEQKWQCILVTVTTTNIVYIMAKGHVKAACEKEILVAEKKLHWAVEKYDATLRDECFAPHRTEWRVVNKGTFASNEDVERWLRGHKLHIGDCGEEKIKMSWSVAWSGTGKTLNTVILDSPATEVKATAIVCIEDAKDEKHGDDSPRRGRSPTKHDYKHHQTHDECGKCKKDKHHCDCKRKHSYSPSPSDEDAHHKDQCHTCHKPPSDCGCGRNKSRSPSRDYGDCSDCHKSKKDCDCRHEKRHHSSRSTSPSWNVIKPVALSDSESSSDKEKRPHHYDVGRIIGRVADSDSDDNYGYSYDCKKCKKQKNKCDCKEETQSKYSGKWHNSVIQTRPDYCHTCKEAKDRCGCHSDYSKKSSPCSRCHQHRDKCHCHRDKQRETRDDWSIFSSSAHFDH